MRHRWITALAAATLLGAVGASAASAGSQAPNAAGSGTAFPFSGTLVQPNGNYDFQFQVYDSLAAGTSVACPVIVRSVKVTSSKYSTRIDFGSNPFTGDARFLQISWRKTATTTFTPLTPRVELVAVPYAMGLRLPLSESTSSSGQCFRSRQHGDWQRRDRLSELRLWSHGFVRVGFRRRLRHLWAERPVRRYLERKCVRRLWAQRDLGTGVAGISQSGGYGVTGLGSSTSLAGIYGSSGRNGLYGDTSSTTDSGVYGHDSSSGYGVTGFSDSGIGGYFRGGGGSNPAIKLENGGIQVSGAGTDTPTPVFTHLVTNSNICDSGVGTILDNPFLNGNPHALIFLQYHSNVPISPFYFSSPTTCPSGRWVVSNASGTWTAGDTFNVLVINP